MEGDLFYPKASDFNVIPSKKLPSQTSRILFDQISEFCALAKWTPKITNSSYTSQAAILLIKKS